MGFPFSWFAANWFSLFQTLAIVGALFFNAYSLLLNSRIRKVDTLINITQQHRAIWLKFLESPGLKRINKASLDLTKHPVNDEEMIFVNLIILHLATVLIAVSKGILPKPAGLDVDVADLFSLPIPHAVWNQTKTFRDPETIRYVEGLMEKETL
jgi:hypothetical protein